MQHSSFRGHPTVYINGKWVYEDTREPLPGYGGDPKPRPCKKCGSNHKMTDHDPCLGELPGVDNACCGHGNSEFSYVRFTNGVILRGFSVDSVASLVYN